ncbi:MAG: glycosyltransferase family 2 protein [Coxiellaceae bacterium]|jgi:glycosyltransferase involved in cell wall biosynthesis|nr:glycosyltransferase family 2 protein [Coxiellaceae bacterium]
MPTISATIITKNEAKHIKDCIESVLWTDEIIILDCGSTDNTQDICKQYIPKVKLYETDWPGFGKQKNRALEFSTSEWVLSIDADERVTPELEVEILQILEHPQHTAYQIPRQNYFLGKPLKFCCGNNDTPIRLAKREFCKFSDDIIHEKMIINGRIGRLRKKLKHYSCDSLEELTNKTNNYSTLGALKLNQNKEQGGLVKALLHASWIFIKFYFIRLGCLDGLPGFIIALNNFKGTFYKYTKLSKITSASKNFS